MGFRAIDSISTKVTTKLPATLKEIYPLATNGRELDEKEIEAEEKAVKFSLKNFKRVSPVPGTLAFLFRNLEGGNYSIIEHLKNATKTSHVAFAKNFIILWNNMDEFSKRRIDIFDLLCDKYNVKRGKFWGVIQEGMFDMDEAITQTALNGSRNELVEILKRMSRREKGTADRRLLAEANKLISAEPLIKVDDHSDRRSVTINTNSPIPSFTKSISKADNGIRTFPNKIEKENRMLMEEKQDYIDVEEFVDDQGELELQAVRNIERATDVELRLLDSIKELD